jgi:uncharacterized protein (DUF58 family)
VTLLGAFLVGAAIVSALWASKNLRGVSTSIGRIEEVFAGDDAYAEIEVETAEPLCGLGMDVSSELPGAAWSPVTVPDTNRATIRITWHPKSRGRYPVGHIQLRSRYPLGWIEARKSIPSEVIAIVYPRLNGRKEFNVADGSGGDFRADRIAAHSGDFAGHKIHREGEAMRHIDWKATARRQQVMLKRYSGRDVTRIPLSLDTAPGSGLEAKLSQLAVWVVRAENEGFEYSLQLGTDELVYGNGAVHYRLCLRMLALYGS